MERNNEHGAHVQNGIAKATIDKATQNGEAERETSIAPKKDNANDKREAETPKPNALKDEKAEHKQEQAKGEVCIQEEPVKEVPIAKPVLNLEGTLKVVDELHRRSIHRLNLISRIKQLEAFEVALTQEHDELEENPYQGCKLIIEDDKQRRFITTTPGLIRLVSQFIFSACLEKLAEIEANIIFPSV